MNLKSYDKNRSTSLVAMIAHTIIVAMKLIQVGFLCVFFGALLQTGRATVDPEVYMNTVSFFFNFTSMIYVSLYIALKHYM